MCLLQWKMRVIVAYFWSFNRTSVTNTRGKEEPRKEKEKGAASRIQITLGWVNLDSFLVSYSSTTDYCKRTLVYRTLSLPLSLMLYSIWVEHFYDEKKKEEKEKTCTERPPLAGNGNSETSMDCNWSYAYWSEPTAKSEQLHGQRETQEQRQTKSKLFLPSHPLSLSLFLSFSSSLFLWILLMLNDSLCPLCEREREREREDKLKGNRIICLFHFGYFSSKKVQSTNPANTGNKQMWKCFYSLSLSLSLLLFVRQIAPSN